MMPVEGSGERKRLLSLVLESSSKIESSINKISLNLRRIDSTFVAYQRKEGSRESEGEREKKSRPSNTREKKLSAWDQGGPTSPCLLRLAAFFLVLPACGLSCSAECE